MNFNITFSSSFSFAREFRLDSLFYHFLGERRDDGLNGEAVARRRLNDRHVAESDQRHVQRARNRRGGEGERVYVFPHFLEAFFVSNAKALFFVHHEQSQILKFHVFRKQPVRADDDIDLAGLEVREDLLLLGCASEAA